jgi:hypothetical protein
VVLPARTPKTLCQCYIVMLRTLPPHSSPGTRLLLFVCRYVTENDRLGIALRGMGACSTNSSVYCGRTIHAAWYRGCYVLSRVMSTAGLARNIALRKGEFAEVRLHSSPFIRVPSFESHHSSSIIRVQSKANPSAQEKPSLREFRFRRPVFGRGRDRRRGRGCGSTSLRRGSRNTELWPSDNGS